VNINIGNGSNNNIGNNLGNNNLYNKAAKTDKSIASGVGNRDMSKMNVGGQPGKTPTQRPSTGNISNKAPGTAGNAGTANRLPDGKPATADKTRPSTKPSTEPNNVFADRDGNVYQKDKGGNIQQNKGGNTWDKPANIPSTKPSVDSRDRVNNKVNNYSPPAYKPPTARPAPSSRPTPSAKPAARPAPSARPAGVKR